MLNEALDLAKKTIKEVHMRVNLYQRRAKKRYSNQVNQRNFQMGNLVLRKCGETQKDAREGKLAAN